MKKIFTTEGCFRAYSEKDDCFMTGDASGLLEMESIDSSTLEWCQDTYENEMSYFMSFMNAMIEAYEKRYRTTVVNIALAGRIGLWNENPIGGKIINATGNPLEHMGRVDTVEVEVDEEGLITINGHHHDGTHRMNIFLLTENKLKKVSPNFLEYGEFDVEDIESIYEKSAPLKMNNTGVGFYGAYKNQQAS